MEGNGFWKKIQIFVSSTFKDMDAERDVLKFHVQRMLNERYKSHRIEFQFIDLRIGINTEGVTEEEAENRVLDVCLANIESSRPFFIGLIGHRYGWIPSAERWERVANRLSAERRALLVGGENKSVTELEILYGAIGGNGENLRHSLFFFRNKDSYEHMPEALRTVYDDSCPGGNPASTARLAALKQRIVDIGTRLGTDDLFVPYSLEWDETAGAFARLEPFADLVYQRLCREIDAELDASATAGGWVDDELLNVQYLHHRQQEEAEPLRSFDRALAAFRQGGRICLVGGQGMGKSVLLSQLYSRLANEEKTLCLSAFVATSAFSRSAAHLLQRWSIELCRALSGECEEGDWPSDDYNAQKASFDKWVRAACDAGYRVVLFLDGIDVWNDLSRKHAYLSWLPGEVGFVGACDESTYEKIARYNHVERFDCELPCRADIARLLACHERRCNIALPARLKDALCADGGITPLRIALLMCLVGSFSSKDIREIRQREGSDIENINNHLYGLYCEAPAGEDALFRFVVGKLLDSLSLPGEYGWLLACIAASGIGLTDEELEALAGGKWDMLQFRALAYLLKDFLCEHPYTHRWYFKETYFAKALRPDDGRSCYEALLSLARPEGDLDAMRPYYAVMANAAGDVEKLMDGVEDADCRALYRASKDFLLSEPDLLAHLEQVCDALCEASRIRFVHGLFQAIDYYEYPDLFLSVVERELIDIDPDTLSAESAYRLGWLFVDGKNLSKSSLVHVEQSYSPLGVWKEKAVEAFARCYRLDAGYRDSRNLLKASMLDNMDEIMKTGDWEKMEAYYSQINSL